jgi:hypothetical protein
MNDERRPARNAAATNTASTIAPVRDAFVRVVMVNEALDVGDVDGARAVSGDLESDLARRLGADLRPYRCACGMSFEWPGLLDAHQCVSGHGLEVAA